MGSIGIGLNGLALGGKSGGGGGGGGGGLDTLVLLNLNGANGGTSFPDASPYNRSVTFDPSSVTSTASFKFGGASLDVAGGGLNIPNSADFNMGSGDFTIECWCRPVGLNQDQFATVFQKRAATFDGFVVYIDNSLADFFFRAVGSTSGTSFDLFNIPASGTLLTPGQWYHLALVREGNIISFYVDGVRAGQANTTNPLFHSNGNVNVGKSPVLPGNVDDFRWVRRALYSGASFTPPASQLVVV